MKITVHNTKGEEIGSVTPVSGWKDIPFAKQAVKDTVVYHRSKLHKGTSSTKIRSEVNFSRRKMWKQKGTGRARVGNAANPAWRKGGIVFGPKPRDFSIELPKKVRNLAFRSVIGEKVRNKEVIIIDSIKLDKPRTKEIKILFGKLGSARSYLIVAEDNDKNILLSVRNIPKSGFIRVSDLDVYSVMNHKNIIITKKAWGLLEEKLFGKKK